SRTSRSRTSAIGPSKTMLLIPTSSLSECGLLRPGQPGEVTLEAYERLLVRFEVAAQILHQLGLRIDQAREGGGRVAAKLDAVRDLFLGGPAQDVQVFGAAF